MIKFAAVDLAEQCDARIHRLVDQAAVLLAHHDHRASAAVTLGAALFGADRTLLQTQPVENGGAGVKISDTYGTAVSPELQSVSGHSVQEDSKTNTRSLNDMGTTIAVTQVMCHRLKQRGFLVPLRGAAA